MKKKTLVIISKNPICMSIDDEMVNQWPIVTLKQNPRNNRLFFALDYLSCTPEEDGARIWSERISEMKLDGMAVVVSDSTADVLALENSF